MNKNWFQSIEVSKDCTLRRKEQFEYVTMRNHYDIELFENQDGTFYAIGVPRDGKFIIYGSAVVDDAQKAIQTVVEKIKREGLEQQDPLPECE